MHHFELTMNAIREKNSLKESDRYYAVSLRVWPAGVGAWAVIPLIIAVISLLTALIFMTCRCCSLCGCCHCCVRKPSDMGYRRTDRWGPYAVLLAFAAVGW